jgi:signal transduction histidine kinase
VVELPIFVRPAEANGPRPFERREMAWMLFELNLPYIRDVLLPEVLQRHLGAGGSLDYQVEVMTNADAPKLVYQSEAGRSVRLAADASTSLLELEYELLFRRINAAEGMTGRWGRGRGRPRPGGPGGPERGHWQLYVRHRAGSLEAVVERARTRNLGVTAGVLLLMLATVGALVRYTRRAQKLAALQMDFVAGVSHELRTPLTVIHTAAYNLRGAVASNPAQVERYGGLIQQESGRLKELVERILRFASVQAGHVIGETGAVPVESVIEETMELCKNVIQAGGYVVEKEIAAGLPAVQADPGALRQALQNLVENAIKYGSTSERWIGISAAPAGGSPAKMVEIRVSDHGAGVPDDEQEQIFDPFFRGRRALQDQIRGTGLGLNLVKKIVEAHGGDIRVESTPGKLTQFIVRLPIAESGVQ